MEEHFRETAEGQRPRQEHRGRVQDLSRPGQTALSPDSPLHRQSRHRGHSLPNRSHQGGGYPGSPGGSRPRYPVAQQRWSQPTHLLALCLLGPKDPLHRRRSDEVHKHSITKSLLNNYLPPSL